MEATKADNWPAFASLLDVCPKRSTMLSAPKHVAAQSAPQLTAAPPRSTDSPTTAIHYFLIAIVSLMLMDFWFEIEKGYGIPEAIIRVFVPLLMKGGR